MEARGIQLLYCQQWLPLYEKADGTILSMEKAGGFSGAYIRLFTISNGKESVNYAIFDYFEYLPLN
nr:hypothetical protein [Alkalihalobacillus sp. LMS39]